jgi:hypothetical protein
VRVVSMSRGVISRAPSACRVLGLDVMDWSILIGGIALIGLIVLLI